MKITVDIDCTPTEARQFLGLPDVEPMQKAVLAEIEKRMIAEIGRFTPENLMQTWMPLFSQSAAWFPEFLKKAAGAAAGAANSPAKK